MAIIMFNMMLISRNDFSEAQVDELAQALANDGFGPHEHAVREFVDTARLANIHPASLDVLADLNVPVVVRGRAFALISRSWDRYQSALEGHGPDTPELDRLLDAWNVHEDLRAAGAPVALLSRSHTGLEQARLDARKSTHSLAA